MNSNEYEINFVIPQGPTGPANGLNAYGGKYNNTTQTISLAVNVPAQIPLTTTMPSLNVAYNPTNSITVNQSGIYEINYYINVSATPALLLTFSLRLNGSNIPSTTISRTLNAGVNSIYSGSTIVSLNAGAVIDMILSAALAATVTFGTSVNASLSIKKIN